MIMNKKFPTPKILNYSTKDEREYRHALADYLNDQWSETCSIVNLLDQSTSNVVYKVTKYNSVTRVMKFSRDKIKLEIFTPEKKIFSEEVTDVQLPGLKGYFGVYPGHTPFISALKIGAIKVEVDDKISHFATSGGFAEVLANSISVLSETCEHGTEIDLKRAQAAKDRAENRINEGRKEWDVDRAQMALARALNRLKVASG